MWENAEPMRVRILRMPARMVADMSHTSPAGHWYRVQHGVPPDARYLGASFDFQREEVLLKFEHESFSPVRDGGVIPPLDSPLFEAKWDETADLFMPKTKPSCDRTTIDSLTIRVPASAVREVPRDRCVSMAAGSLNIDLPQAIDEARAAVADTPVTVGG